MQIKYSPDADVLIIRLRGGKPRDANDLSEGIIIHYDETHAPLEIEILDASKVIDLDFVDVSLREFFSHNKMAS